MQAPLNRMRRIALSGLTTLAVGAGLASVVGCAGLTDLINSLTAGLGGLGGNNNGGNGCTDNCIDANEQFCDSDCDGWFDSVEAEFGFDKCDDSEPNFAPDSDIAADICGDSARYAAPLSPDSIAALKAAIAAQNEQATTRRNR